MKMTELRHSHDFHSFSVVWLQGLRAFHGVQALVRRLLGITNKLDLALEGK